MIDILSIESLYNKIGYMDLKVFLTIYFRQDEQFFASQIVEMCKGTLSNVLNSLRKLEELKLIIKHQTTVKYKKHCLCYYYYNSKGPLSA